MKAAWDRGDEHCDPACTSGIVGRTPQRPDCGPGKSVGMLVESPIGLAFGFTVCRCQSLSSQWLAASLVQGFAKDVGRGLPGRRLALPGPMGQCAQHPRGSMGRMASSFCFFVKKEAVAFSNEVPFKPVVPVDTLKACALIGLHILAGEGEAGSSGSLSLDLGDMWRHGCTRSPEWISSCSASETLAVRCTSTTTSAGQLKSSGRIGQAKWWRSFSRIGSLGEDLGPSLPRSEGCVLG